MTPRGDTLGGCAGHAVADTADVSDDDGTSGAHSGAGGPAVDAV